MATLAYCWSGHFCSSSRDCWYTLQNHSVAQAGYTCGCLGRVRVMLWMQWTVTACTLLWLVATRNTAHIFGGSMLFKLGRGSTQLTECSWADNLQLSWQVAAELTAEFTVAAELTAELTRCSWADRLQLSQHDAAEMTSFIWADRVQLSWHVAAELTAELKCCSWSDKLQLSWH